MSRSTMTYNRSEFRLWQFVFDLAALTAAWRLSGAVRVACNPFLRQQFTAQSIEEAAPPLEGILILWIASALWRGVYRRTSDESVAANLKSLAGNAIAASLVTIATTFFSHQFGAPLSRSFVLIFAPVSFLAMLLARCLALLTASLIERFWPAPERVAVVGTGPQARRVVDLIREADASLVKVAGVVLPDTAGPEGPGSPVPVLGRTSQLAEVINRAKLDRLVVVSGCVTEEEAEECGRVSWRMGVVLNHAIANGRLHMRPAVRHLYGLQTLELRPLAFTRKQEVVKRVFDVVVSLVLLIVLLPVLALSALLIKLTSEGPVFYRSWRVGRGGRHFQFLKFRSMYAGSEDRRGVLEKNEKGGHLFKIKNDPRVTFIGRFLRRYSLDELPQLFNVLMGDMSLVGPRPLPAQDLEMDGSSRLHRDWAEQRAQALPGITGLWQIRGRSDLDFEQMVEYDIAYIRNWSLALDLRILLETPMVVMAGRGAY